MNTQALSVLTSLKSGIDSNITGLQAQSDALASAITLLQNGYVSDQATIDAAVSAALEPVQASIAAAIPAQNAVIASPAQPAPANP